MVLLAALFFFMLRYFVFFWAFVGVFWSFLGIDVVINIWTAQGFFPSLSNSNWVVFIKFEVGFFLPFLVLDHWVVLSVDVRKKKKKIRDGYFFHIDCFMKLEKKKKHPSFNLLLVLKILLSSFFFSECWVTLDFSFLVADCWLMLEDNILKLGLLW